jgi:hypothetical protein
MRETFTTTTTMRAALHIIVNARDYHADTGDYPSYPYGPRKGQCFDDWAADLAEVAIAAAGGA